MHKVNIADRQTTLVIDRARIKDAVRLVLDDSEFKQASISVAIVDDPTIHELNRRFLNHDYPTDVLSFPLERGRGKLEGEVVASADTALRSASDYGWRPEDELLLYIVHGALHLVGYDDHEPEDRAAMRAAEAEVLARFGLSARVVDGDES